MHNIVRIRINCIDINMQIPSYLPIYTVLKCNQWSVHLSPIKFSDIVYYTYILIMRRDSI